MRNAAGVAIVACILIACFGMAIFAFVSADPVRKAQAENERLQGFIRATQSAQAVKVEATRAAIKSEQLMASTPAIITRDSIIPISAAISVLIFMVGSSAAAVSWARTQARLVRPNRAGLYPAIIHESPTGVVIHKINDQLGAQASYVAGFLPAIAVACGLQIEAPAVNNPGSEELQAKILSQTQAVSLMLAAMQNAQSFEQFRQVAGVIAGPAQYGAFENRAVKISDQAIAPTWRQIEQGDE